MAKAKTRYTCQQCGYQSSRFLGRCTSCEAWGSFVEEAIVESTGSGLRTTRSDSSSKPMLLDDIEIEASYRRSSGIACIDEVLGGGIVPGSVVLLAGDPGIGKSTLLLQLIKSLDSTEPVLYLAGEESLSQVKLRASRLGLKGQPVLIDGEQNISTIEKRLDDTGAQLLIVDSIQSVFHPEVSSAPGSVSQVRECAYHIINAAKSRNIACIMVGHVTKEGMVAGPRVLEHMVDVVLQFEGDKTRQLRLLRAIKNRFGSTQEIAIFSMSDNGLSEVENPSAFFLSERLSNVGVKQSPSGTAVIAGGEGTRALLLEVQALVGTSAFAAPRRLSNGFDNNRLLQILAVLEKKVGLGLSRNDVYVNVVGGFEFDDPSGDLGVAVAVATSCLNRSIDPGLVFLGEIGLTGEIRAVSSFDRRLKEAHRLGFTKAIVPLANVNALPKFKSPIQIVSAATLLEALKSAMPGQDFESNKSQDAPGKYDLQNAPGTRQALPYQEFAPPFADNFES